MRSFHSTSSRSLSRSIMRLSLEAFVTFSIFLTDRFRQHLGIRGAPFYNPTLTGGSMLINAGNGLGEPLNVGTWSVLICSEKLPLQ